ncbi:MAG: tRNA dihydrouridine synthase DusB [Lachnospiraceae bacterium]|nr:tRNA dihydrouridine synthase DusB [Lachnospiraceae bacterium]
MKSIDLGNITIEYPLGLAPMAGVTDSVYRKICKENGAGLLCTEMVSAKAIVYKNKNTAMLLKTAPSEGPVAVQMFGSEPEFIAEAIEMTADEPYDILDFNMGCPVPKVVKNHEGSSLMSEPELAKKIFTAMVRTSKKPVTVKMRSGFDAGNINAPLIAKIAEDCGVSAVAVHARTREQFYSGKADWSVIKAVKEAVSIPVFGNGDIRDGASAKACLDTTGCDGLLVGRAAMGNPWIFREIRHFLDTGETMEHPGKEEIFKMIIRHAKALAEEKGEYIAVREMRSHAAWYTHGFPKAAALRREINTVDSIEAFTALFS